MSLVLHELENKRGIRLSPYCWSVRMALKHKGLDFKTVGHSFLDIPNIHNGFSKTVPIMETENGFINESRDIAVWLDKHYPDNPLIKGSLETDDTVRFIYNWFFSQIHPAMSKIVIVEVRNGFSDADQAYFNESRAKRFGMSVDEFGDSSQAQVNILHDKLKPALMTFEQQPFIGGTEANYADYILFGYFMWARLCSDAAVIPSQSPLHRWWQACLDLFDGYARGYLKEVGRPSD